MDKNYKLLFEKERRENRFLFAVIIIILIGFISLTIKCSNLKEESENMCYLNNKLVDTTNSMKNLLGIEFEDIIQIDCDSGNAERRLSNE